MRSASCVNFGPTISIDINVYFGKDFLVGTGGFFLTLIRGFIVLQDMLRIALVLVGLSSASAFAPGALPAIASSQKLALTCRRCATPPAALLSTDTTHVAV